MVQNPFFFNKTHKNHIRPTSHKPQATTTARRCPAVHPLCRCRCRRRPRLSDKTQETKFYGIFSPARNATRARVRGHTRMRPRARRAHVLIPKPSVSMMSVLRLRFSARAVRDRRATPPHLASGAENRNASNDTAALSCVENSGASRYVFVVVVVGDVMNLAVVMALLCWRGGVPERR